MNSTISEIRQCQIGLQNRLAAAMHIMEELDKHNRGITIYGTLMTGSGEYKENLTRIIEMNDKALKKIRTETFGIKEKLA